MLFQSGGFSHSTGKFLFDPLRATRTLLCRSPENETYGQMYVWIVWVHDANVLLLFDPSIRRMDGSQNDGKILVFTSLLHSPPELPQEPCS